MGTKVPRSNLRPSTRNNIHCPSIFIHPLTHSLSKSIHPSPYASSSDLLVLKGKAKDTNESTGSIQITDPQVIEAYETFIDQAHTAAYTAVSTGPAHAHLVESEQRSVAKKRAKKEIQTYLGTLARDLCKGRQGGGEIAKASRNVGEPNKL